MSGLLPMDTTSAGTSATKLGRLKPLEANNTKRTEISLDQFERIRAQNSERSAHYNILQRSSEDWARLLRETTDQLDELVNQITEMKAKKQHILRIGEAIGNNTASRRDRQIFEDNKDIDMKLDALRKKDHDLMAEAEKFHNKMLKAREDLQKYTLGSMNATHVYEQDGRYFKMGGGATFLAQPTKEDEALVGAAWVNFWTKEQDLCKMTTPVCMPMIKRYMDCVDKNNGDYAAIATLHSTLLERPTVSRYEFYDLVQYTLREGNRDKFLKKVNNLIEDEDVSFHLKYSMDPQKSARQMIRFRQTAHHQDSLLLKEASNIWSQMSEEEKKTAGLTDADIRKAREGNKKKGQNNGKNGGKQKGDRKSRHGRDQRNNGHYSKGEKGGHKSGGQKGGKDKDYRHIPKEAKKENPN